ncbi:MAG: DsbA family protein [Actinomycetaceae bacterium]
MPVRPQRRQLPGWVVPAAILTVAAVLIAVILGMLRADGEQPAPAGSTPPAVGDAPTEVQGAVQQDLGSVETRDEDDLLAAGPVDAPVALVVFSDYQCPFCARWNEETLPLMMEHAEAGDLRIEWRDVNIFGPASERASRASYAAALQGEFWTYHDALFAGGEHRSEAGLSDEALVELAGELGLDTEQFAADMSSEETASTVDAYAQQGLDVGAFSTPAFVLGGQAIVGAQPTEVFEEAFAHALAAE